MVNRVDPVVKFRFAVQIKGQTVGWFTECSGLSVERETVPRPEGGTNDFVHQLPGRVKQSRVTLKRGLADNALWKWFEKGLYDGKVERYNISIILYNSDLTKKTSGIWKKRTRSSGTALTFNRIAIKRRLKQSSWCTTDSK